MGNGKRFWTAAWAVLLGLSVWLLRGAAVSEKAGETAVSGLWGPMPRVVVDAGHGGVDGGAVGADGSREADVNFRIAMMLKEELEEAGCRVILTRSSAEGVTVNGKNVSLSKRADMQARKEILEKSGADLIVSIHQNAYPDPRCRGAQVFWQKGSGAQTWAERVQISLAGISAGADRRLPQEGDYFLRAGKAPAILVECGFMSNPDPKR